jgi:hypothetical protein
VKGRGAFKSEACRVRHRGKNGITRRSGRSWVARAICPSYFNESLAWCFVALLLLTVPASAQQSAKDREPSPPRREAGTKVQRMVKANCNDPSGNNSGASSAGDSNTGFAPVGSAPLNPSPAPQKPQASRAGAAQGVDPADPAENFLRQH